MLPFRTPLQHYPYCQALATQSPADGSSARRASQGGGRSLGWRTRGRCRIREPDGADAAHDHVLYLLAVERLNDDAEVGRHAGPRRFLVAPAWLLAVRSRSASKIARAEPGRFPTERSARCDLATRWVLAAPSSKRTPLRPKGPGRSKLAVAARDGVRVVASRGHEHAPARQPGFGCEREIVVERADLTEHGQIGAAHAPGAGAVL